MKIKYQKQYTTWKGQNYFWCSGTSLTGGQSFKPILFTSTILSIPPILYFSFNIAFFLSPTYPLILLIIPCLTYITSLILFCIAGFSDPGIMKRNNKVYGCHETFIKIVHKGVYKKIRLCTTCQIAKPPRSAHCADCDNCVMKFDHHCPWIGNCVAKRNYIYFYFFLLLLNVTSFFILGCAVAQLSQRLYMGIKEEGKEIAVILADCVPIMLVVIYVIMEMLFITGLFFYHSMLVCRNMSTKEELKKLLHSRIGNYYSRGCCFNCKRFWKRELPYLNTLKQLNELVEVKDEKEGNGNNNGKEGNVEIQPYMPNENTSMSKINNNDISSCINEQQQQQQQRVCNTNYNSGDINININHIEKGRYHTMEYAHIPQFHFEDKQPLSENLELQDLSSNISIPQENTEIGEY